MLNKRHESVSELIDMQTVFIVFTSIFAVFLHKKVGSTKHNFYLVETQDQQNSVQNTFEADHPDIQGGDLNLETTGKSLVKSGLFYI